MLLSESVGASLSQQSISILAARDSQAMHLHTDRENAEASAVGGA
jgi:hypothetical protein